jgi:ABC-type oligopeptide transport system substrate-binding subunit
VEWSGIPVIQTPCTSRTSSSRFETRLEKIKPADLLTAPEATQKPIGWGPYVISEWVKGDHITLQKNPKYFRAAEVCRNLTH